MQSWHGDGGSSLFVRLPRNGGRDGRSTAPLTTLFLGFLPNLMKHFVSFNIHVIYYYYYLLFIIYEVPRPYLRRYFLIYSFHFFYFFICFIEDGKVNFE